MSELSKDDLARICGYAAWEGAEYLIYAMSNEPNGSIDFAHTSACTKLASFILMAGRIGGEPVYRYGAAQGLHVLPADGWADLEPEIRIFFEAYARGVQCYADVVQPKRAAHRTLAPSTQKTPLSETIFDTGDGFGARHEGMGPAGYVPVVTKPEGMVAAPVPLTLPTSAELAAMLPEQRRDFAALQGFGDWRTDGLASTAPPLSGTRFEAHVEAEGIVGAALVTVPAALSHEIPPAAAMAGDEAGAAAPPQAAPAASAGVAPPAGVGGKPKK